MSENTLIFVCLFQPTTQIQILFTLQSLMTKILKFNRDQQYLETMENIYLIIKLSN